MPHFSDERLAWNTLVPSATTETDTEVGWSHSGIAVTASGTVVFAEPSGGGLILFRPGIDGGDPQVERREVPLLDVHGIFSTHDSHGELLWLADPGFKARPALGYETESRPGQAGSLDLATFEFTPLPMPTRRGASWQPTSVIAVPTSDDGPVRSIVADGYGASVVHFYSDGVLVRTVDGGASGTAFACPHGLALDTRAGHPLLVVADRGNRRLVCLDLDGTFVRTITDPLFTSPSSLAIRGDDLLVTELDGALLAVSPTDEVRALVDTRTERGREGWPNRISAGRLIRPPLEPGVLNSPHGLAVSPDGRIYLTEWVIGGRQLELSLHDSAGC